MTDRLPPLTEAELDKMEAVQTDGNNRWCHAVMTFDDAFRLIAQAREANALRALVIETVRVNELIAFGTMSDLEYDRATRRQAELWDQALETSDAAKAAAEARREGEQS